MYLRLIKLFEEQRVIFVFYRVQYSKQITINQQNGMRSLEWVKHQKICVIKNKRDQYLNNPDTQKENIKGTT